MTDPRKKILRMILGLTLYAVVGFLTARWFNGSTNFSGVGPVHAADFCGRVTAMWLRIRRW
jgi:hypothetical protein